MKSNFNLKSVLCLIFGVLLILPLSGCDSDSDEPSQSLESKIIGSWRDPDGWITEFNEDYSGANYGPSSGDGRYEFIWEVEDDEILMYRYSGGSVSLYRALTVLSIDANKMEAKVDGRYTWKFTRCKEKED